MTRPVLRAAFGYAPTATSVTWTDITPWLNLKSGVRISRGASDELSQTQPSLMNLVLDNEDGRFSSGLATSPYYPYVRPNCPIQLGVLTGGKNLIQSPTFESNVTTGWTASTSTPPLAFAADGTRRTPAPGPCSSTGRTPAPAASSSRSSTTCGSGRPTPCPAGYGCRPGTPPSGGSWTPAPRYGLVRDGELGADHAHVHRDLDESHRPDHDSGQPPDCR
ncbi:hypothetical protein SF23_07420 [Streptomyces sp. MBRL 10]|nr:hypothetical protein SF23_07420 [Streptomyces sp. MBRL 10]